MKYVALICARGGSKGLPGKNIKLLQGVPLIGWAIKTALKIDRISRVIVSTDSEEIAKIALKFGAEVPFMRPKSLSLDNSPEWLVWRHAINYLENNTNEKTNLVILPSTSPLRSSEDVNMCINEFEKNNVDSIITVCEADRSPYFNMVKNDINGYASLLIKPEKDITRRQDSPKLYNMTTVAYVVKSKFIKESNGIFEGKVKSVIIPQERAIDIDNIFDFQFAESLLLNKKN
jgi:CMP-N-acetylneuraminic acid synthetase